MTPRERVLCTLNHKQPDRVAVDFGGTFVTGINASTLYKLREALKLEKRDIYIDDFSQMLGHIDQDLDSFFGSDVIGMFNPVNSVGVPDSALKKFIMSDGTPTLISERNKYYVAENGYTYVYPQGDNTVPPSLQMPPGGYFFDVIDRAEPFDEDNLTPIEDFKDTFHVMSDDMALYFEKKSKELFETTDKAIVGNLAGGALGSPAQLPGPAEKHPKGIRKFNDWLMAQLLYPEYIEAVFELQTENMIKNLEIYHQAVGERICAIFISGTDFGTQNGLFFSAETFRKLYKPYFKCINDWIHQNTSWKTFYHSCGSNYDLMEDFIEMGMDIFNPVQISAHNMQAKRLKEKFGSRIVFWGGGIDTQHVLSYGTEEEVYQQTMENLSIFSQGGGFVFNTVHNIVAKTPVNNIMAMIRALHDFID